MDQNEYWRRLSHAEEILAPLFRAKSLNWDAQAVSDLLTHLFSLARKNGWLPQGSDKVDKVPFFEYYDRRIGQRIWRATASISTGRWTEERYRQLNFHGWQKPGIPKELLPTQIRKLGRFEIVQGPQSPLRDVDRVSKAERLKNRKIWNSLFRDVMFLNRRPGAETYEDHPYSTYVFRFERLLFREHIWRAVMHGIDHSDLCEYVLRPLYFSAMYEVRSLVPRRISDRQRQKAENENGRLEILPLLSLCRYCLRPIKRSLGGRKTRSDTQFCAGNTCKNAYHRRQKTRRK